MIAAGHPELFFEFSAYHARLPKHWPTTKERIDTRNFEFQSWLAGQIGCLQSSLELRVGRAARAQLDDRLGWPDLAEQSCFTCHQRMRPADRSGLTLHPTAPTQGPRRVVHPWYWPLDDRLVELAALPRPVEQEPTFWRGMLALTPDTPVAQRTQLRASLRTDIEYGTLLTSLQPPHVLRWLQELPSESTWEHLCQRVLALSAMERTWDDEMAIAVLQSVISEADRDRQREQTRVDRRLLQDLRESLAYSDSRRFPRILGGSAADETSSRPRLPLAEIGTTTVVLAKHWELHWRHVPPRALLPADEDVGSQK